MVQKKRGWSEGEKSRILETFVDRDETKCPKDKTDLELSPKVEYNKGIFTFSCRRCARTTEASFDLLEGRYLTLGTVGHGTMGVVYVGRHLRLARRVAIKQIDESFMKRKEEDFSVRFEREIRILSSLDHRNIVKVFDRNVEEEDKALYFVMEYIHGGDLGSWIKGRRSTLDTRLVRFSRICDAVRYAHSRGVIHRDLKPSNILLTTSGEPKVADFGLAKFLSRDQILVTSPGSLIGSFPYMAPEQYDNPEEVDHRGDIYSLGVLFYQMLTGRLPFINPPKITTLVPRAQGDLDKLFNKMTENDREKRYQSIDEFREDFQAVSGGKGRR